MDKKEIRCYGCMKIKKEEGPCPYCGYDNSTPNEAYQIPAGTVLREQYLVGRVLGQGGFGITYMGWDRYLEIPVAIKEFFPTGAVSRSCQDSMDVVSGSGETEARFCSYKERFIREVKLMARLSDVPGIAQVKTFFTANNTAYIVMDYIEGMTLKKYVEKQGGALEAEEALNLLYPVMGTLRKIHKAGMVHRDISPDNIMLQEDGTVKLLDFGAVRDVGLMEPDKPLSRSTDSILKQGFAPVEQYQSRGILGAWTDIYALCATIYYCLTGKIPEDALGRMMGDEIIWFQELGIDVPPGLEEILRQGMELKVENRIQDVRELYDRLTEIVPVRPRGPFGEEPCTVTDSGRAENDCAGRSRSGNDGKPDCGKNQSGNDGKPDRGKNQSGNDGKPGRGRRIWIVPAALTGILAVSAVLWLISQNRFEGAADTDMQAALATKPSRRSRLCRIQTCRRPWRQKPSRRSQLCRIQTCRRPWRQKPSQRSRLCRIRSGRKKRPMCGSKRKKRQVCCQGRRAERRRKALGSLLKS